MLVLEPVMFVSGWVTLACLFVGGAAVLVLLLRRLRRHRPRLCPQDSRSKTAIKTVSLPVQTQDDEPNPDVIPHSDGKLFLIPFQLMRTYDRET